MIYTFEIQEPYKSFLLGWEKTIEWRLNTGKFKEVIVWDILQFETWESFKVLEKSIYKTFYEMMIIEWIDKVLPDYNNIQKWVREVYYKFYSQEQEKEYWVVGLKVIILLHCKIYVNIIL